MSSQNQGPSKTMAEVLDPIVADSLLPSLRGSSLTPWTQSMSPFHMSSAEQNSSFLIPDASIGFSTQHGSDMSGGHFYTHPGQTDELARRRGSAISTPEQQYLQSTDPYGYEKMSAPIFHQQTPPLFSQGALDPSSAVHRSSVSSSSFMPIAPDPIGLQRLQRNPSNASDLAEMRGTRRKRPNPVASIEQQQAPVLRDDEKFLLNLKDDQGLPWKEIASKFQTELGQVHQIPALQMRYKRLKERLPVWTDNDASALKQAHEYWEQKKWEIISEKMLEFGAQERFSARSCARKWEEMNPGSDSLQGQPPIFNAPASHSPTPMTASQSYPPASYPPSSYWSPAPISRKRDMSTMLDLQPPAQSSGHRDPLESPQSKRTKLG